MEYGIVELWSSGIMEVWRRRMEYGGWSIGVME
jgi:hypothetical protein